MTWTDQNGTYYSIDSAKFTAVVDLTKYHGQANLVIPKYVKYENCDYAIIHVKNKFSSDYWIENISFENDSLVSSFEYLFAEKIIVPPKVESIRENFFGYFQNHSAIQFIEFLENSELKYIDMNAFSKCKITNINIPASVIEIIDSNKKFKYGLKSVSFTPNSRLRKIGSSSFMHELITTINIPPSVTEIDNYAFFCCENLQSIEFSDDSKLKRIGNCAFSRTNIKSIKIPICVIEIGNYSLKECKFLSSIEIPYNSQLKTFGNDVFSGTKINHFRIPSYVENLFVLNASQLDTIEVAEDNEHYSVFNGLLIYNNEILCFAINNLTSVCIPSSIKEIHYKAFENHENIKEIEFDDNSKLEIIDGYSFMNSTIEKVKFPSKLRKIESDAFKQCKNLHIVEFTKKIELSIINEFAFQSSGITSIEIPSQVMQIGNYAFEECYSLKSIKFANYHKILSIGEYSFQSTSITEIEIPSSVQQIGKFAFNKCYNLKTVTFFDDSDLRYIEQNLFYSASQLEMIKIPSKVLKIEKSAFEKCKNLKIVEFVENSKLYLIDDYAFKETSIESIIIPSSVKRIGIGSFENCSLNSLKFMEDSKLKLIDKKAFSFCKFSTIKIPSSVQFIDDLSFSYCNNLQSVEFEDDSQLTTFGNGVFKSAKIKTLKIPSKVEFIKEMSFEGLSNLESIEVSKENKHFSYLDSGLLLYKDDENSQSFDAIFILNKITNIKFPSFIKNISMNALSDNNLEYIEFPRESEINFLHKSSSYLDCIRTIVVTMSLFNLLKYICDCFEAEQIGILDDDVIIDEFTFAEFYNLKCISLPNAKTIRIEKGCQKLSIIALRNAKVICDDINIHEIRKVHSKLLEKDKFPSLEEENNFLYENLYL